MFKVGDIVTGVSKEYYGITTDESRMCVKEVRPRDILVELLSHKEESRQVYVGKEYFVDPRRFVLVRPKFKGNI